MSTTTTERSANGRVARRELTYGPHNDENSFFRDVASAFDGDQPAEARLKQHGTEMRNVYAEKNRELRAAGPEGAVFEKRVNPSTVLGHGGEFAPPSWLEELYATAPRPDRVIADLADHYTIPAQPGFGSIHLPILTTGTTAQVMRDNAVIPIRDIETTPASTELAAIVGDADVALQLLEQSPLGGAHLDRLLYKDLISAYDAALESELTAGTGANETLLGVLNVVNKGEVAYTSGSPAATAMYPRLGEVAGYVSDNRKLRLECWIMRGGRWFGSLLATGQDEQKRPLAVPFDVQSPTAPAGPIGTLLGNVPVYLSESIPTTLGTAKNTDAIIATRPSDMPLWESPFTTSVFTEPLSGTMGARIILRAYAGFIPSRYPSSTCILAGTGLKVETDE